MWCCGTLAPRTTLMHALITGGTCINQYYRFVVGLLTPTPSCILLAMYSEEGRSSPRKAGLLGSIRYRIIIGVLLLIFCIQLISAGIQSYQIRSIFLNEFVQGAQNHAQSLFLTLNEMVNAGVIVNQDIDDESVRDLVDIYVQIIQFERFAPILNSKADLVAMRYINSRQQEVAFMRQSEQGSAQRFLARGDTLPVAREFVEALATKSVRSVMSPGFVHVVVPYLFEEEYHGALILSYGDTTLKRAILYAFAVSAVLVPIYMVVISAIVYLFITRVLTRPLRKISHLMTQLAAGELDQWYEIDRLDEIGEVGESVNDLVISLKSTFSRIKGALTADTQQDASTMLLLEKPNDVLTLVDGLGRAEFELRRLSRKLIDTIEDERKRVAFDLHDSIGQVLTTLQFDITLIENSIPATDKPQKQLCSDALNKTRELGRVIRATCARLRPTVLDDMGLLPAIRSQLEQFHGDERLAISFSAVGNERRLNPKTELTLYRVVQESFNNILKHSFAKCATISLRFEDTKVSLTVEDDGIGFAPNTDLHEDNLNSGGIGLLSMKERVVSQGGDFSIYSERHRGTKISAWLPVGGIDDE